MTLTAEIMNIPCRLKDSDFASTTDRLNYKTGHRDARHDACDIVQGYEASQQEHDKESLSVILWLLRRLPRTYENPPHIVGEVLRLSKLTGIDCVDVLNERMSK